MGKAASVSPSSVAMVADADYPAVSVIIYSAGDPVMLDRLITEVFAQDYPAEMEVIVVNDGKIAEIKDVVTRQQVRHRNLYVTFTPLEARNLSRRKLALTLGIKAARNEVVVLTDDCCLPASDWWLRLMMYPFAQPSTEMVVGHAAVEGDNGFGGACRRFTMGADAVEYMSAVQSGRPYRATGHNLAYRRDLFFNNKGFSRSLNLHDGDDDIFVNEVARRSSGCPAGIPSGKDTPCVHCVVPAPWHTDVVRPLFADDVAVACAGRGGKCDVVAQYAGPGM